MKSLEEKEAKTLFIVRLCTNNFIVNYLNNIRRILLSQTKKEFSQTSNGLIVLLLVVVVVVFFGDLTRPPGPSKSLACSSAEKFK